MDEIGEFLVAERIRIAVLSLGEQLLDRRIAPVVHVRRGPPGFHQRRRIESRTFILLTPQTYVVGLQVRVERGWMALRAGDPVTLKQLLAPLRRRTEPPMHQKGTRLGR